MSLPRWQWRTFGRDLSHVSTKLDAPDLGRGRWSDEVHLVCQRSLHHAWLAKDTLELLWRKVVGSDGCELWDSILRASLPFDPSTVAQLFAAWGQSDTVPARQFADVDTFVGAVEAAAPCVRAVRVARRRERTSLDGIECSFETLLAGDGGRWQSFAVEHEDPAVIAHVLRTLGLDARDNVNFVQGLKQALGLAGERH